MGAASLPVVYLAGPIRDGYAADIAWREQVIQGLSGRAVFLNPLGAKTYEESSGVWRMSGIPSTPAAIVRHDAWCVDRADIVLANMSALADKYPMIGFLLELGRAWGRGKLIYVIVPCDYTGHENRMYASLHPFLQEVAAARFDSVLDALTFLQRHLDVLSGKNPHFEGAK